MILQVHVKMDSSFEEALRAIGERFPAAIKIELICDRGAGDLSEQLSAALATLPDVCWAAVEAPEHWNGWPAPAAAHLPRLCPRMRELAIQCRPGDAAALADALEALAAAKGTLEALHLSLEGARFEPDAASRAAAALAALSGLRRLGVSWGSEELHESGDLLATALRALTPQPSPVAREPSPAQPPWLMELTLRGEWALDALRAARQLGHGVTSLHLHG